jgi:hypothetical protein
LCDDDDFPTLEIDFAEYIDVEWLTSIDAARGGSRVLLQCHRRDVAWLNAVLSNAMESVFEFQNW